MLTLRPPPASFTRRATTRPGASHSCPHTHTTFSPPLFPVVSSSAISLRPPPHYRHIFWFTSSHVLILTALSVPSPFLVLPYLFSQSPLHTYQFFRISTFVSSHIHPTQDILLTSFPTLPTPKMSCLCLLPHSPHPGCLTYVSSQAPHTQDILPVSLHTSLTQDTLPIR